MKFMRILNRGTVQPTPFPDKTFVCDPNVRTGGVISYSRRGLFFYLSLSLLVVFSLSTTPLLISPLNDFQVAISVTIVILSVFSGLLSVISSRRPKCSLCSKKMKKKWILIESRRKALFFVCERDRRYVDAFFTECEVSEKGGSGIMMFLIRLVLFAFVFPFINAYFFP